MTITSNLTKVVNKHFLVAFVLAVFVSMPVRSQEINPVYTLQADGLACPFCAFGIEKELSGIEGVLAVETDLKTGTVTITMVENASLEEDTAEHAVEAAGFTMREFKREGDDE